VRLTDLPPGVVRLPAATAPIFLPPPVQRVVRQRRGRRRLAALLLVGFAAACLPRQIGEQDALAGLLPDRPAWAPAVRAPDPGVSLSPHVALGPVTAAVGPMPAEAPPKKADRLGAPDEPLAPAPIGPSLALLVSTDAGPAESAMAAPAGSATARDTAVSRAREAAGGALAYAAPGPSLEAPFDLLLSDPQDGAERPHGVSGGGRDHWWSDRPLPEEVTSPQSLRCLAEAVYFEARGESETGQRAVAQVVINRLKNPAYPDDVCAVVYQNRSWRNRCQFTFACDGVRDVVHDRQAWSAAKRIARAYASGKAWLDDIGAATHYHARHVTPSWARLMRRVRTIDHHMFYITRNGGWT